MATTAHVKKCGAYPCKQVLENNQKYVSVRASSIGTSKLAQNIEVHIDSLKPHTTIFFFAANKGKHGAGMQSHDDAYKGLKNAGIAHVSEDGKATIHIACPQVYMNEDGHVYPRHFHFWYLDKVEGRVGKFHTRQIFCSIDAKHVKRDKSFKVIHAKDGLETLSDVAKHTPIAISGTVEQSEKRKRMLEKHGYMNTWHISHSS